MGLKKKVVDGKTVWYTDSFGLDENTTFDSKTKLYNYFGAMGVQPGQIDPSFGGGTHGGVTNLGKSDKTYSIGDYKFNASGVIIGGPCGIELCAGDIESGAADQVQWDLIQAMSATAVAAPRKIGGKMKAGAGYQDLGPKKKKSAWKQYFGDFQQEKVDSRTARKQKLFYDSRSERKAKRYSRPGKRR